MNIPWINANASKKKFDDNFLLQWQCTESNANIKPQIEARPPSVNLLARSVRDRKIFCFDEKVKRIWATYGASIQATVYHVYTRWIEIIATKIVI